LGQGRLDTGGQVVFVTACSNERLLQRLEAENFIVHRIARTYPDVEDWQVTAHMLAEYPDAWVVLDGYHFDGEYQQRVKESGHRLLVIDDMAHLPHYYADIVLNQNINAESLHYDCEPYTKLLLGTKYVLLRREFLEWEGRNRQIPDEASKVLVTLGGGDPENATLKVIQALEQLDASGLEAKIVVGLANPNLEVLCQAVHHSTTNVQLLNAVTDMPELMAWADLAVSGGGSTSWELAFMGVPGLILILAENQRYIAEELDKIGVVLNLGWHEQVSSSQIAQVMGRLLLSAETRKRMATRGQDLVDGDGVDRVLMVVRGKRIRLRQVCEKDARLVWEWANDPSVRTVSFSAEPIPWGQHLKWFQSKLKDPDYVFYIALDGEDIPIGQIRYDLKDGEAIVSISLDSSFRGQGYGREIIELSSQKLFKVLDAKCIHSYVKMSNEVSVKMFLEAGFKKMGMEMNHGEIAVHLILSRKENAWPA